MASVQGEVRLEGDALRRIIEIENLLKRPQALWKEVARRVANEFRTHFAKLEEEAPNKLAPDRRSHFWAEIRGSVGTPELSGDGAAFSINDPRYGLQVYGGVVRPREAKALAIPVNALGYNRRPAVFQEETGNKLFRPKGKRVLMADIAKDGNPVVIYILAASAKIPPHPKALPESGKLDAAAIDQAEKHLSRALANGGLIAQ